MKAVQINGTIKTHPRTPKSWGNVLGGFNLLSDSDLESYGFYDVIEPDFNEYSQELGNIEFDSENGVFTYSIENITWTESLAELKEKKITNLKRNYRSKLEETDWVITRDLELGNTTEQSVIDARASLRTECSNHESSINSLTTKKQIAEYQF